MHCFFSVYTFARPGEVRSTEWSEIKDDVWDIPAEKMKMKRRHIVPLSKQVKEIIEELRPLTGKGRYLFPSPRNNGNCMSDNGVRIAGYGFHEGANHSSRIQGNVLNNRK